MNYTDGMRIIKGFNKTSHQPFIGVLTGDTHVIVAGYPNNSHVSLNHLRNTSYGLQEAAGQPTEISWDNLPSEAGSIIGIGNKTFMLLPKTAEYNFYEGERAYLTTGGICYKQSLVEELARKTPPVIYTQWKDVQSPLAD